MLRKPGLNGCLLFALLSLPAAATADGEVVAVTLSPVTVLATRTQRPTADVPRSVDVVDEDTIAHQQSNDLASAIDRLPNVSISGSPRPSGEAIQIRGLSGEHILTLVDGVRQDFTKGHLADTFIDPGLIKRIEVERGPASVLWGSGALGGVVSVQTRDARDLLKPGASFGARLRGGYRSATDGWLGSAAVYGRLDDRLDGLLHIGRRKNGDLELGSGGTLPYSAYRQDSLLGKTTLHISDHQFLRLAHRSTRVDGVTPSNPASVVSNENPLLSRHIARDTTQLHWSLDPARRWVDIDARVYHGSTRIDEDALSFARHDHTSVDTHGLDLANSARFDLAAAGRHTLTAGVDGFRDRANGTRDGAARPEFPEAHRRMIGLFAQDQIDWDAWVATLGLRYDNYHSASAQNVAPSQSANKLSSQAGLLWQATDWLAVYANYAQAFHAPTLDELYATGTHFGANRFVPNPGLKPERAANQEIGLRTAWQGLFTAADRLTFDVSAFRNEVKDFIDTIVTVTPLPGPPYIGGTTRSENVTDARLEGFEARARYGTRAWFADLGYGQTRGHDRTNQQPLAAIAPDRWVLRLGYTALPWRGRVTFRATVAESQHDVPTGVQATAGHVVFDLLTSWYPLADLRVDVAVKNLTDKAYRRHNAVIDEAGRNVAVDLSWNF